MTEDPRLPDLYGRAAELEGDERARWLDALRAGEPDLAHEVERLLAADGELGERLEVPAWRRIAVGEASVEAPAPVRVGPYRIVREIGRGGMGRVFLAEQEAEAYRRTVALKVLDRSLLSAEAVRRFRDEVRILASLVHPGIARFLDGGRAADGTWFLALEFVEGVDLVEHARRDSLSADDRVGLFLDVLEAVEHAHRSGVVHRDLKPANVLIGADGRPRLLDFGISKLVDLDADGASTTTHTESRLLTPAYASPEQFRGERATVASDVYSAGVVLYELLSGVHPHRAASGSRGELERAVLDVDPEPPSTAARHVGARNGEEPPRPPALRWIADLDAICLKALRKEPEARYPSAQAFAEDLQRYLGGLPVEARRGGLRYRLAKLVRRRRVELAAAAAALLAVAALGYAVRVRLHASRTVASAAPAVIEAAPAPKPFPIERRVNVPVEELERRFAAEPANLQAGYELASSLMRLGRTAEAAVVVGRMRQIPDAGNDPLVDHTEAVLAVNLDEPQRALALATRALEGALAGGRGELVPRIRSGRARLLSDLGRHEEALVEQETVVREAAAAGDSATLARAYNDLAITKLSGGDLEAGERLLERATEASRAARDGVGVGTNLHNLAGLAAARDDPGLAAERYRAAIGLFRAVEGRRQLAMSLGDLADILRELGRPADGHAPRDEALAIARELGDESTVAYLLFYGAIEDFESARLDRIEAPADEIEQLSRASGASTVLALAELLRGYVARERGETGTARTRLGDAARILVDNGELDWAAEARLAAAELELADERPAAAAERADAVRTDFASAGQSRFRYRAEAILARAAARAGRLEEAERRRRSLAAEDRPTRGLTSRVAGLVARAEVDRAAGRYDEARRALRQAIAIGAPAGRVLAALRARLALAEVELVAGRRDLAAEEARVVGAECRRLGLSELAAAAARAEDAARPSTAAAAVSALRSDSGGTRPRT